MALGVGMFYIHTVGVETYQGTGINGAVYAASVNVPCFVDDSTHLVLDKVGKEVVSQTVIFTDPSNAALFPTDSRVTVNGRKAHVITVNNLDASGLMTGLNHVEVHLT